MNKKILTAVFGILLLNVSCGNDSNSDADSNSGAMDKLGGPVRLIIQDSDMAGVSDEVGRSGGNIVRKMEFINGLVANLPVQALEGIKKKFPNSVIYEDQILSLVNPIVEAEGKPAGGGTTVQPPQSVPWGIASVKADLAWSASRGDGVKVCVVDTGVSKNHPDLAGNLIGGRNYVSIKGTIDSNKWDDDNGHGSHVAGTIAALDNSIGVVGVAPNAKLYGVKVLNRQGSGYTSDITDGIYACMSAGVKVINMSLGGSGDPTQPSPFKDAVNAAISQGIFVVAAAGNSGKDISGFTPASFPGVIAVSAVNSTYGFPSWSNFGLGTDDFAAPGVSIPSTWLKDGYNTISGTSMASPHVAGVIALGIAAGSLGPLGRDIGATLSYQGAGFIDALLTVGNVGNNN